MISWLFGTKQRPSWVHTKPTGTDARAKSGVPVGELRGDPVIDTTMYPIAVLGPCRSGKSTSFVVPALLTWQESAIVTDVQGDLYTLTDHWRRSGAHNEVRRLAFDDELSPDTFNLLDAIPCGEPDELSMLHSLATALLPKRYGSEEIARDTSGELGEFRPNAAGGPLGDPGHDIHQQAQSLLMLCIIANRSSCAASLPGVYELVIDDADFKAAMDTFLATQPGDEVGFAAKNAAAAFADLDESVRTKVRALVAGALTIFASPVVARNTARSSFSLRELQDGTAPMTVYLSVSPWNQSRLRPLIRAFLSQVVLHAKARRRAPAHRMLLALDDAAALGLIDFPTCTLSDLPDYGIKPLLTIQSLAHVRSDFGDERKFWAQFLLRVLLPPSDCATAKEVAPEIESTSRSGRSPARRDSAEGHHPIETLRLGAREAIILGAANEPTRIATVPYYCDAGLKGRAAAGSANLPKQAADAIDRSERQKPSTRG